MRPPPLGSFVDHFTKMLLQKSETELSTYLATFFADHVNEWRTVINEAKESNQEKAKFLWKAQLLLIAAILAVAALSLSKLIG